MNTIIRNNMTDLPYSLHDAVVTSIEVEEDKVIFRFTEGFFEPSKGDCSRVEGYVEFERVDHDFCVVYVINSAKNEGSFRGRKMSLKAFAEKYFVKRSHAETPHPPFSQSKTVPLPLKGKAKPPRFEIIREAYGYNKSTFSGCLWVKKQAKECILELYHAGDMRYVTE